ncbi:hypothetical protein ACMDCR_08350 [Labrys okinawensis]|uniref:hypothetical protein n=1 Tax=Labrys okinawensis TaxID=346911 RepID=UPI0039BD494C
MSMHQPNPSYRGDSSLGVGQIVNDAWNTSIKSYLGLFFLNLPILIAAVAAFGADSQSMFSADGSAMEQMVRENMGRFITLEVLIFIVSIVCSCAMTRILYDRYVGAPVSDREAALTGAKRSLPALLLLLIFVAAYIVFAFVVALVLALLQGVLGFLSIVLAIALGAVFLYLVFPYVLSGIVCITEELGPIASLRRSKYLTSDYRWPVLGVGLAGVVVMAIYQGIVLGLDYLLAPAAFGHTILLVFVALIYPLLGGWVIGLFVITAHRLRALKDGVISGRNLSNVFE